MEDKKIIAYKGFNHDMTCRGFQFEEGKTYECEEAVLCEQGFHACLNPIDVLNHYIPANSVYHIVELEELSNERTNVDSKVCARKITIRERLSEEEMLQHAYDYAQSHCKEVIKNNEKDLIAIAGNECSAVSEHIRGIAIAGEYGVATTDYYSTSIVGNKGVALTYYGCAIAGDCGISSACVDSTAIAGSSGIAIAGDMCIAVAKSKGLAVAGDNGCATILGRGTAKAGFLGVASTLHEGTAITGDGGVSSAASFGIANTGKEGVAAAGWKGSAKSDNFGISVSKGASQTGEYGVSVVRGKNVRVKGGNNALLVIVEEDSDGNILHFATAIVGKDGIEHDTWYELDENGKLVKCKY